MALRHSAKQKGVFLYPMTGRMLSVLILMQFLCAMIITVAIYESAPSKFLAKTMATNWPASYDLNGGEKFVSADYGPMPVITTRRETPGLVIYEVRRVSDNFTLLTVREPK